MLLTSQWSSCNQAYLVYRKYFNMSLNETQKLRSINKWHFFTIDGNKINNAHEIAEQKVATKLSFKTASNKIYLQEKKKSVAKKCQFVCNIIWFIILCERIMKWQEYQLPLKRAENKWDAAPFLQWINKFRARDSKRSHISTCAYGIKYHFFIFFSSSSFFHSPLVQSFYRHLIYFLLIFLLCIIHPPKSFLYMSSNCIIFSNFFRFLSVRSQFISWCDKNSSISKWEMLKLWFIRHKERERERKMKSDIGAATTTVNASECVCFDGDKPK